MGFATLAFVYAVGGVTFLPLLALLVLLPAWLWLPKIEDRGASGGGSDGVEARRKSLEKEAAEILHRENDGRDPEERGASGVFAVLRTYDFALANAALTSRSSGGGNAGGSGTAGDPNAQEELPAQSDSVYQAMYRSVFDRGNKNKDVNALRNEGDDGTGNDGGSRLRGKANASRNLFYIVLRHGHLMLYSSSAQVEVKHVISLAHHTVGLSEGGEPEPGKLTDRETMQESDLFVKRSAIVLTPISSPHVRRVSSPRSFYFFAANCSDKEDFYHALLAAQPQPPIPLVLQPDHLIKLQSNLHATTLSATLTPETRAIDALIGRLFLGLYKTDFMRNHVKAKIERKISRVQKPAFIESVICESVDLGDSAPVVSNLRLRDLNITGELVFSADVRYTGNFKLTLAALAKIDLGLGQRFKPRTVPLLLAGILKKLQGHVLVRIKPPPSNRMWVCFEQVPEMELKIEPVVGVRQISYGFILRAIENKIREVVTETLVKPNWDDLPFFDSSGLDVRGGIWQQEPKNEDPEDIAEAVTPVLEPTVNAATISTTTSSAASSSTDLRSAAASIASAPASAAQQTSNISLKRRSVASLPLDQLSRSPPKESSPRPIRSPSFTATATSPSAPSVALHDISAESVRGEDIPQQPKRWRTWAASGAAVQAKKDAREAIRDLKDRTTRGSDNPVNGDAQLNGLVEDLRHEAEQPGSEDVPPATLKPFDLESSRDTDGLESKSVSAASLDESNDTDADRSLDDVDFQTLWQSGKMSPNTAPTSQNPSVKSNASTASSSQPNTNPRAKALLAATTAATNAAKAWYVNRKTTQPNAANPAQSPPNAGLSSSSLSSSADTAAEKGAAPASSRGSHQRRTPSITSHSIPEGPYGRGQPLPPPGTPLPGPEKEKSGWSLNGVGGAAAGFIAGAGGKSLKRKPVLPPRQSSTASSTLASPGSSVGEIFTLEVPAEEKETGRTKRVSGEFGPWAENAGSEDTGDSDEELTPHASNEPAGDEAAEERDRPEQSKSESTDTASLETNDTSTRKKKTPPPLPVRPASVHQRTWDSSSIQASRRTSAGESVRRPSKGLTSELTRGLKARADDIESDEVLNIPAPLIDPADEASSAKES